MIKLPKDKYGNEGWVVKARKRHRCEGHYGSRIIEPGEHYYRAIAWPGSDVHDGPAPWVMKLCRDCLSGDTAAAFDAALPKSHAPSTPEQPEGENRS